MSIVMRKSLPRPSVISLDENSDDAAVKLIKEEMLVMMVHDNKNHATKKMKSKQDTLPQVPRDKEEISAREIEKAQDFIEKAQGDLEIGDEELAQIW